MTLTAVWMEAAKVWAEGKMSDGWDRKDGLNISIFYTHMLSFIADNFNLIPKNGNL